MPLYEYRCESCGETCEILQKLADPLATTCESCGGPLKKLHSSPAIQFKGSGFYITDYSRKSESAGSGSASESSGESSSESKSADSGKADTKKSDSKPSPSTAKD